MSAKDFAKLLGVAPSQVTRWENGAPMSGQADRLLRMIEVKHDNVAFDVQQLAEIGDTAGAPMRLRVVRNRDGSWKAAA
jgi:transcriptional regulator with XRE-family HTH domain